MSPRVVLPELFGCCRCRSCETGPAIVILIPQSREKNLRFISGWKPCNHQRGLEGWSRAAVFHRTASWQPSIFNVMAESRRFLERNRHNATVNSR